MSKVKKDIVDIKLQLGYRYFYMSDFWVNPVISVDDKIEALCKYLNVEICKKKSKSSIEVKKLKEIAKYVEHSTSCMHSGDTRYKCTCGLNELLKQTKQ